MKKLKTLMAASLVAAAGFSGAASAHDYLGTLGTAAAAKDIWYFTCLNPNTAKVQLQVKRQAGTPCVKAALSSPALSATSCSTTTFTTLQQVATGSGNKVFIVSKNPAIAGTLSYTVRAHCIDNTGVHNPADQTTPQTYLQNQ
ncbi:hypothetical protein MGMO_41c00030 [Methyloglobulus morosus KoM1]|uniref:Uncharacterized protein n=1 Tax=Methyloglobulus morosus KoM1 TaxID=1116472 RepID=V5C388_9GAMM|nr:hypothetical protein [Methyloglobulus morosus]ESS72937.1 hypothetical protein MGMO_41c00030 [Methyloglobulus morosus KoM1]